MNKDQNKGKGRKKDFSVPENYFETGAKKMLARLEWMEEHREFEQLLKHRNTEIFETPAAYFEKNAWKLELSEFETLRGVPKKNMFVLNEGYFERAEHNINKLVLKSTVSGSSPKRKILPLFSPRGFYAAAALLIIVIGLWLYNYYFVAVSTDSCTTLACIERSDLIKSKNLEALDADQLFEIVNTRELEEKLNALPSANEANKTDTGELQFDIEDFPDDI